jgi:hypothetical protein
MFELDETPRRTALRLDRVSTRRRRSDAGRSRLHAFVIRELRRAALGQDPPSMTRVRRQIAAGCVSEGLKPPARASLYNALVRIEGHRYRIADLPGHVAQALYNLAPTGDVPGHQLAFYCFNYGSMHAISYAAGLPWLDLYQARHARGWRPRSRGLLAAVMRARGIR